MTLRARPHAAPGSTLPRVRAFDVEADLLIATIAREMRASVQFVGTFAGDLEIASASTPPACTPARPPASHPRPIPATSGPAVAASGGGLASLES
jgi:hypothetical protein